MERRVLVLRPQPGAGATASRLTAKGFAPVLLPLSRIIASSLALPAGLSEVAAVAATSANALRHADPSLVALLRPKPLFAVGAATAAAARDAGFDVAHVGTTDGLELARQVADRLPAGAAVAYLCGKVRRPEFEQDLAARGLAVLPLPTYDTLPVVCSDAELQELLGHEPIWAAMVHSPNAGAAFAALATRSAAMPLLENARIAAISAPAAAAVGSGFGRVEVAEAPSEEAMLRLLSSWT